MKNRPFFVTLLIFTFFLSPALADNTDHKDLKAGLNSIQPADVYGYCKTMALPRFAGRLTGHEGYTKAAAWAAGHFRKWGLKPISRKDGYLQPYPSPYTLVREAEMTLLLPKKEAENDWKEIPLKAPADFLPHLYTDSGSQTGELVFAGWGISAPDLGYDDYAGIEVKGKFIVCFRGTPDSRDKRFQKYDYHRHRMNTAKERGALGLFYIYDEPIANPNGDLIPGFTPAMISYRTADRFLAEKKLSAEKLKKDLQKYKNPLSFPLRAKVRYSVTSEHFPEGIGYNVAGYIEGSDPELKKEFLVIGGHYDHCGEHMGMLFAGADDNASGCAVVMEIAQAFAAMKKKPKRSVVFVLFGGEEMGLMGSKYFADNPPPMIAKMDAMYNFDMVGAGDKVRSGLTEEPAALRKTLEEADKSMKIIAAIRVFRGVGVRGSDYASFYNKGIPCAAFFSNGPHLHYHLPGDTIYRINPDIMADVARLAFTAGYRFADR